MNTEEYRKQCKEIEERMSALQAEKDYVTSEYIKHNALYQVGDRIITSYGRPPKQTLTDAMITGHKVQTFRSSADITYISVKVKRDGTLSGIRCIDSECGTIAEVKERGYGQRMGFIKET